MDINDIVRMKVQKDKQRRRNNVVFWFSLYNNLFVQTAKSYFVLECPTNEDAELKTKLIQNGTTVPNSYKEIEQSDFQAAFLESKTGEFVYSSDDPVGNKIRIVNLNRRKDINSKIIEILSIPGVKSIEKSEELPCEYHDGYPVIRVHYDTGTCIPGRITLFLDEEDNYLF